MNLIARYFAFVLIGAAVGSGKFDITDWNWWAWVLALNTAIAIRDSALRHNASLTRGEAVALKR